MDYQKKEYLIDHNYNLKNNKKMLNKILKLEKTIEKNFVYEIYVPQNIYQFFLFLIFKYNSYHDSSCKEYIETEYQNASFEDLIDFETSVEINIHCLDLFIMYFTEYFSKNLFFNDHSFSIISRFRNFISENAEFNFISLVENKADLLCLDADFSIKHNDENEYDIEEYFKKISNLWILITDIINNILNLNVLYYKTVPEEFDAIFSILFTEMKNRFS